MSDPPASPADHDTTADDAKQAIEAVVLVAHDPVPPDLLAQLLERPVTDVERWCAELAASVRRWRPGVPAGTRRRWLPVPDPSRSGPVRRAVPRPRPASCGSPARRSKRSPSSPTSSRSRAPIASIRGVDPDGVLRTLQGRGYIDQVGRDPGPGQAMLYGTTPAFLLKLGVNSLDDLPPLADHIPGADVVEALEAGLRVADGGDPLAARGRRLPPSRRCGSKWPPGAVSGCRRCSRPGGGSRRVCEELIAPAGRATVNGGAGRARPQGRRRA